MIKLIILVYAIGNVEPIMVGKLMHPFEFTSIESCKAFGEDEGWRQQTLDEFAFDYRCEDITPTETA